MTVMPDEELRKEAIASLKRKRKFGSRTLLAYVTVNGVLWLIWALTDRSTAGEHSLAQAWVSAIWGFFLAAGRVASVRPLAEEPVQPDHRCRDRPRGRATRTLNLVHKLQCETHGATLGPPDPPRSAEIAEAVQLRRLSGLAKTFFAGNRESRSQWVSGFIDLRICGRRFDSSRGHLRNAVSEPNHSIASRLDDLWGNVWGNARPVTCSTKRRPAILIALARWRQRSQSVTARLHSAPQPCATIRAF